ncbi:MAG: sugar transferase [Clostridiales bacterium]|nr:sugar transferase [Clostridiales bacterium]
MSNAVQKQRMVQNYCLIVLECFCIIVSYIAAMYTRGLSDTFHNTETSQDMYLSIIIYLIFFHVLAYFLLDWNVAIFKRGYFVELIAVVKYNLFLMVITGLFLFLTQLAKDFSRIVFVSFFIYNILFTYAGHLILKHFLIKYYRKSSGSNKTLIITTSDLIGQTLKQMNSATEWGHEVSSIILMDEDHTGENYDGIPVVANRVNLYEVAPSLMMDEVFINLPEYSNKQLEKIINQFEYSGITVNVNVDFFDILTAHKTTENFAGFTVLSYAANVFDYRRMMVKRIIDIIGALVGLAITAILTPFVALAIRIDSPGPIFFKQKRMGKNGREFYIYKFRSMYIDAEERKKELMSKNEMDGLMFKMTDDPRVTKVGKFIRKTSIDELPQFWNILIGQMSLVGTRPPTIDEFQHYNLYYRRRLSIKPGLTGLWQVSGRSDIQDFDEVVKLDLQYIDDWSLTLDIKILFMTVFVVLFRRGSK